MKLDFNPNKLSKTIRRLLFLAMLFAQFACEDIIQVNVQNQSKKIVVDAFINTINKIQTIHITRSIGYFDSSRTEPPVTNAKVAIIDQTTLPGKLFVFTHEKNGKYHFTPNPLTGDTFTIGHDYALLIVIDQDTLLSLSRLHPTAKIDSIRLVDVEGNGPPINTTGKYIELIANDIKGKGDFYWIKTFRNDSFLNSIDQLNISPDMGNTSIKEDGQLFIYPVRYSKVNDFSRSFKSKETVRIEIHSINGLAFAWFNLIANENQNGGLFATPPINIFTNIVPYNETKKIGLAGFFCMSAVASASVVIP